MEMSLLNDDWYLKVGKIFMIKVNNVLKKYGSFTAVDNISFDVRRGEICGFLGPNGAGKTSTIKMIIGLSKQDNGSICVNDIDTRANPIESKKMFSYVPDNPEPYEFFTGIQYLNFLADIYKIPQDVRRERIRKYADAFEFYEKLPQLVSSYSHGMKQKVSLIGALIHEPEVFILDEPMVGLDPKSSFKLKEIMRERCALGKSVFFSTHVMEVAEKICDRIIIINKGTIIATGTLEEIHRESKIKGSLEDLFLELTE